MSDFTKTADDTLCKWWCQFNCFEWPPDYPVAEPDGWNEWTSKERYASTDGKTAWNAISKELGKRNLDALAYWNGPFGQGRKFCGRYSPPTP